MRFTTTYQKVRDKTTFFCYNQKMRQKTKTQGSIVAIFLYVVSILLLLLKQVLMATAPLILNIMIDGAVLGKNLKTSYLLTLISMITKVEKGVGSTINLSCIILIITLTSHVISYISDILNVLATESITKNLRDDMHKSIQRFTYKHYIQQKTGDLIQRCTSNIETVRRTLNHFVVQGVGIIFSIIYIFIVMMNQNVKLCLLSSLTLPIILISSVFFFIYIKKLDNETYKREAFMTSVAQENLGGVRVVKAFSMQEYEMQKFEKASKDYKKQIFKENFADSFFYSTIDAITFAQIMFVTIYGSYLAYLGELTVGQVVAFSQYIIMLIFPVRHLGRIISNIGRLSVSIKRIKEVLNAPKEDVKDDMQKYPSMNSLIQKKEDSFNIQNLRGDPLTFQNVSFSYDSNKETEVLHDVSFEVGAGQMLGVIGMTGSGKTSLIYLLENLYRPSSGSIKIGNVDISSMEISTLRGHIAVVWQEPFLYSKTIKENIRIGKLDATDDELIVASKKACLHKDIVSFDKEYETLVGENGITLSGGQKQRLAIARALLKDAYIIVFDDSLSSVDTATDAQIREAISSIQNDKIVIVISHRLSSIKDAQKIIVLEKGRVIEEGTHENLMMQNGTYKKIYDVQNAI